MKNYNIPNIPERELKPRKKGLTMVMDKGLSVEEANNMLSAAGHLIDYVKLGFGTSYVTKGLEEKIRIYAKNDVNVFFGGTLFEAFLARDATEEYIKLIQRFNLSYVEISDGTLNIPHELKLKFIEEFTKYFTVLSEVGSKNKDKEISDSQWVEAMNLELEAGASYVIAEARESGNIGVFDESGSIKTGLVEHITQNVNTEKIIWEAPKKEQQVWFIKSFGTSVNLGNIASNEVIPLETLRLGLRSDTFFDFLRLK